MNVLLLSMPDFFEHTPTVSIRMPNGALTLAGNVDPHHRVAVADLVLNPETFPARYNALWRSFSRSWWVSR